MKKRLLCTLLSLSLCATPLFAAVPTKADTTDETPAPSASATAATTASPTPKPTTTPFKDPDALTSSTLVGTSPFTTSKYTHSSVFIGKKVYHGIDVSYHNGTIDWAKAAADGVHYAFIRVGYRGYGSGKIAADPKFETYIKGATAAGIAVGLYFFTEAKTETEAKEEAAYCIEQAKNYTISLPIAFDYEYQYNAAGQLVSPKAGISKAAATANCRAFCDAISAAGYTPMIYANSSDLKTLIDGTTLEQDYPIWLANYTTKTKYTGKYDIWQYSSKGSVAGISTKVDCNFWYSASDVDKVNFEDRKPKNIKKLTATGGTKKITLTWNRSGNANGYQIYRTNTYNGSYKKVKTITSKSTLKWTNTKLSADREYYYKVRPYRVVDGKTYYGSYLKVTAATSPAGKAFEAPKNLKMLKKPSASSGKRVTIPGGATTVYLGKTVLKNKKKFYHVQYKKGKKVYEGYVKSFKGLKLRKYCTTKAKVTLKATAKSSAKTVVKIPKNTQILILGTKKSGGKTWYRTSYHKGRKYFRGYVLQSKTKGK